jgi:hypothetical protein
MDPLFIHESVIFLDPNPKYKGAETGLHGAPRVGSAAWKFRFTILYDECILMCSAVCMVLLPENMHAVQNTLVLHPQEHNNNLDAVCHTRKAGDATARPAGLRLELSRTTTTSPAPSSSRSCATAHGVTCFTRMTALISSPF